MDMTVRWGKFKKLDGREYRQIELAEISDLKIFEAAAAILEKELEGIFVDKIDGTGQRYWHYKLENAKLILHLEHYMGITLYPAAEEKASEEDLGLLEKAYKVLSAQSKIIHNNHME